MKKHSNQITLAIGLAFTSLLLTAGNIEAARDPGGHTRKGVAAARSKQWDKAAAEFTKAIEEQPKDAKNYSNRGEVYKITGKLKKAEADFTKAIELKSKNADAYLDRGQVRLREKNRLDDAIADLDVAVNISPRDATARRFRAYAYMQKKQWQKAIDDYTVAINRTRKIDVEGRTRRGFAYRNLKQYDKAIEDFTKVIEAAPKDVEAYRRRAYAYTLADQNDKAAADLEAILKLKPNDTDAQKRLKALQAKAPPALRAKPKQPLAGSPGNTPAARPTPTR